MVGYMCDMPRKPQPPGDDVPAINRWVWDAVESSGKSQAAVSDVLAEMKVISAPDRSIVNKMTKGIRGVSAVEAAAISKVTGYPMLAETGNPKRRELNEIFDRLPETFEDILLQNARDLLKGVRSLEGDLAARRSGDKE